MSVEKINLPKTGFVLVLRPEFFNICDESATAAALLSLFVFRFQGKQQAWLKSAAGKRGEDAPQEALLVRYKKEQLIQAIMGIGKEDRVVKGLKLLEAKGLISTHRNPNPSYAYDKAKFILVHPQAINSALLALSKDSENGALEAADSSDYQLDACSKNEFTLTEKYCEGDGKKPRAINKNIKNLNKKQTTISDTGPSDQPDQHDLVADQKSSICDVIAKRMELPTWMDRILVQRWYQSTIELRGVLSEEQILLAFRTLIIQVEQNRWDQAMVINNAIAGGWVRFYPCNRKGEPERNELPSEQWLQVHGGGERQDVMKGPAKAGQSRLCIREELAQIDSLFKLLSAAPTKTCRDQLTTQIKQAQIRLKKLEVDNMFPTKL